MILGLVVGGVIFFFVAPGKPAVGVINIPFTVIDEGSTFVIGRHLDYALQDDSIKAVVISLSSPGGGASSSERLYFHTSRLREEKPVVIVMNGNGRQWRLHDGNGRQLHLRPAVLPGRQCRVVGISGGTLRRSFPKSSRPRVRTS